MSALTRWSRLKRGVDTEPDDTALKTTDLPAADPAGDTLPDDLCALDPARLASDFDFSRLMRDDVPAAFRAAGLRRLWSLAPDAYAPDQLDVYCEDYNAPKYGACSQEPPPDVEN